MRTYLRLAVVMLLAFAPSCDEEGDDHTHYDGMSIPDGPRYDGAGPTYDARPPDAMVMRVTWNANIRSVVAGSTPGGGCHGGASPAGNYSLTSYAGALGNGADSTPNVIPGNAGSLLITHGHAGGIRPDLIAWIVNNNAAQN